MSIREQAATCAAALASTPYAATHWSCNEVMATLGISRKASDMMWAAALKVSGARYISNRSESWAATEAELRCPS